VLAAQAHPTRLHVIKLNIHDLFLNKYRKYLRSTYPKVDNT
jgi:tRNA A37 threonylcarbamoyladenosine dehydratase